MRPEIGCLALGEVKPAHVLKIIGARRDTPKTAEGVRTIIQQAYNYAIQKLLVEVNPALPLRGVIEVSAAEHHKHLREAELGLFWRSVEKQGAHFVTIAATKMLLYSMCRKCEVLRARRTEIDVERAWWDVPAERMKMKVAHRVYLSTQALQLLALLKAFSPAAILSREHGFSKDVVELLLAHTERSQTAAAYHHHELPDERRRALQYLADQIDRLAAASVAPADAGRQ